MMDSTERNFKLSLTIAENDGVSGAHVVLALTQDDIGIPVLMVQAGGFSADNEGAGEIADMLRDTADAIDDHLGKDRPHTDTATLSVVKPDAPRIVVNTTAPPEEPKRPRFNPKPRGAQ